MILQRAEACDGLEITMQTRYGHADLPRQNIHGQWLGNILLHDETDMGNLTILRAACAPLQPDKQQIMKFPHIDTAHYVGSSRRSNVARNSASATETPCPAERRASLPTLFPKSARSISFYPKKTGKGTGGELGSTA